MKTGFRNTQWDPLLLCAQIVAIQSILYVSLGFIIGVMDVFVDANHTLDHLFQYHVSANKHSVAKIFTRNNVLLIIFRKSMSLTLAGGL